MNNSDITIFGKTTFRNQDLIFGIKKDDRRRHMYLIGKTGMGKSTVQENMIIEDIRAGRGVAVVDPHGDLAEKIINFIPSNRVNDVIYFNPADMEYPIAFNVVEQVEPHLRHLVASGLLGVFQKLWADSWGPRLEYILRNAILAVLDYPGSTLLAVTRMLSDKVFRKKVIEKVQDPVVKAFWVNEFAGYADKFAAEAVSPIQNKVGQFLSSSLIRNIVGQVKSSIDMRDVMDNKKILIMNLSKGRIGEDNSALLGAMMITKIQLAAMSRVDILENKREDFYLYVDEFQNFATDSFANILSEARKYRLNLIMAHQYIEQLGEKVKPAVFGNVGTMIIFRIGAADAEELAPEFLPVFNEEDLVNIPKYEFYIKLMIDGISSDPFSAKGLPPLSEEEKTGNTEKVIGVSRERYAKKREVVEEKISRWHESPIGDEEKKFVVSGSGSNSPRPFAPSLARQNGQFTRSIPEAKDPLARAGGPRNMNYARQAPPQPSFPKGQNNAVREDGGVKEGDAAPASLSAHSDRFNNAGNNTVTQNNNIYKYSSVCSRCGKDTKVSFIPDGIRPVLCRECLSIARREKRDEIEKRRIIKEEELRKAEQARPKEVSLKEAIGSGTVDFKGNKQAEFNEKKISSRGGKQEGELNEGENVKFGQSSF